MLLSCPPLFSWQTERLDADATFKWVISHAPVQQREHHTANPKTQVQIPRQLFLSCEGEANSSFRHVRWDLDCFLMETPVLQQSVKKRAHEIPWKNSRFGPSKHFPVCVVWLNWTKWYPREMSPFGCRIAWTFPHWMCVGRSQGFPRLWDKPWTVLGKGLCKLAYICN